MSLLCPGPDERVLKRVPGQGGQMIFARAYQPRGWFWCKMLMVGAEGPRGLPQALAHVCGGLDSLLPPIRPEGNYSAIPNSSNEGTTRNAGVGLDLSI